MSIIGNELYAKDLEAYPSIPQGKVNHLQQITDFVTARSTYVDSEINSLVETDLSKVAVTSLVLDKENLNLIYLCLLVKLISLELLFFHFLL